MRLDDRFDDLVASLGGFFSTWLVYIGMELGYFQRLRDAGAAGLTPAALAAATGTDPEAAAVWAWAADAHELAEFDGTRLIVDDDIVKVLIDDGRPEYLGGQFVHAVVASLDWDRMLDFFRTGSPIGDRPDRYRAAIERLTVQDIAVFFQEVLGAYPQLVADLSGGGRVVDIHCGGGRWLIAMARRFPAVELIGVEFEADSVTRARANVEAAGLSDRIRVIHADVVDLGGETAVDLAYYQYALHQLTDPVRSLSTAWAVLRPGGRIAVLDWPLPSTVDEFRSRHGELIAGVQLDELYQGTRLATRETYLGWFDRAGVPAPEVVDLPSGATLFLATRPV